MCLVLAPLRLASSLDLGDLDLIDLYHVTIINAMADVADPFNISNAQKLQVDKSHLQPLSAA